MKQSAFFTTFFGIFIAVGLGLITYGSIQLADYNGAERVEATVVSSSYLSGGSADVLFEYEKDGQYKQVSAHFENIKLKGGVYPYYQGAKVILHIDKSGKVRSFGRTQIIMMLGGAAFAVVGMGFLYAFVLRKKPLTEIAYEYEQAMVSPDETDDDTVRNEAIADELTKLPRSSLERKAGEIGVWGKRLRGRFATFTIFEHLFCFALFLLPMIAIGVFPYFRGYRATRGWVASGCILGFVLALFVLAVLKFAYFAHWKILVQCGKFSERKCATVERCAFESESSFQMGTRGRTYTVSKKFRVVACIDGVRSVGFVKGNVPPEKGAVLKVLIRPNRPKKWIIER